MTIANPAEKLENAPAEGAIKNRRLLGGACWLLAGNLVSSCSQYAVILLLARWGTAEMVGQYALAVALTAPPILFANCALRTVQAADALGRFEFRDYLAFRLASLAAAGAAIVALAAIIVPDRQSVVYAVAAAKFWESLGDLLHGAMQRRERMDLIGQSQLIKGLFSILAAATALWLAGAISSVAWAIAAAFAASLFCFDLPLAVRLNLGSFAFRPRWSRAALLDLAKLTFPLGLTVVTGALLTNLPRYFLSYFQGDAELGVFASLAWLTLAGNLFASAAAHAALPRLSRRYARGESSAFRELSWKLLGGAAAGGGVAALAGCLFAPLLLKVLYGPLYAEHAGTFRVLIIAMGLAVPLCALDHVLYAAQRYRVQVPLNAAAVVLTAAACWFATPSLGMLGAAWTICIVTGLGVLARGVVVGQLLSQVAARSSHGTQELLPLEGAAP